MTADHDDGERTAMQWEKQMRFFSAMFSATANSGLLFETPG